MGGFTVQKIEIYCNCFKFSATHLNLALQGGCYEKKKKKHILSHSCAEGLEINSSVENEYKGVLWQAVAGVCCYFRVFCLLSIVSGIFSQSPVSTQVGKGLVIYTTS